MYALETRNLSKSFGSLEVLHNVSLTVEEGERRAIIGPNGAGKTTLFNILTGFLSATSGEVYAFGHNITYLAPHARVELGMGRTFQITRLFFDVTALGNAMLATQALKPFRFNMFRPQSSYDSLRKEAQILLDQWGLLDKRDELVRNLAYGEQRKLEIVMAMASRPKLILLDEPTAGMTRQESSTMIHTVRNLEEGTAIILIEHDMDFVFGLDPDRITVLHYGEVIAEGKPQEIKDDPRVREVYLGGAEEAEHAATD